MSILGAELHRRRAEELIPAELRSTEHAGLRSRIRQANADSKVWTIVLDDDPTGSQCVQGVPVLTRWAPEDLKWAFSQDAQGFFILTNTRALNEEDARTLLIDVARSIERASEAAQSTYSLITRSDSTLRGHFPLETDVLVDLAKSRGTPYDAMLMAPAYIAAGRITSSDVHYVADGGYFVPVGQTVYARDATFGFVSSNLRDYVEEKTAGAISAGDVVSLSLEDIRVGGAERVRDVLLTCRDASPVIVNAVTEFDLDVVALGLIEAEKSGVRVVSRTGPSFVAARLGLADPLPLTHAEIFAKGTRTGNGLVVVGSHVELTTRQVARMIADCADFETVELNVPLLLDPEQAPAELARCEKDLLAALRHSDAMLVSSRDLVVGSSGDSSLIIAQTVSAALSQLSARAVAEVPVKWVLAKGGITSSDVATDGLNIRRAMVAGQLFDGFVSVWVHQGGDDDHLDGLPYIVFAGNVGDETSLAKAVTIMRGASDA